MSLFSNYNFALYHFLGYNTLRIEEKRSKQLLVVQNSEGAFFVYFFIYSYIITDIW